MNVRTRWWRGKRRSTATRRSWYSATTTAASARLPYTSSRTLKPTGPVAVTSRPASQDGSPSAWSAAARYWSRTSGRVSEVMSSQVSPVLRPASRRSPRPTPLSSRSRSRPVRRVTARTARARITHRAPLPKGWPPLVPVPAAQRSTSSTTSTPTAAPIATKRSRQVRTTSVSARAEYSSPPESGGNTSSRAQVASGPGMPRWRAVASSATRKPRVTTAAAPHSHAGGRRRPSTSPPSAPLPKPRDTLTPLAPSPRYLSRERSTGHPRRSRAPPVVPARRAPQPGRPASRCPPAPRRARR